MLGPHQTIRGPAHAETGSSPSIPPSLSLSLFLSLSVQASQIAVRYVANYVAAHDAEGIDDDQQKEASA